MEIRDSRRLTGTNLQIGGPAAIAEVSFSEDEDPRLSIEQWRAELKRILPSYALENSEIFCRHYEGGAAIGFTAAIDMLYGATEINEWAIAEANAALGYEERPGQSERKARVDSELDEEKNPRMRALQDEALSRKIPFLWDDDFVSVGYGEHSVTWPTAQLPETSKVPWERCKKIPVALITGTNGKTTTSRVLTRILCKAGYSVGNTSTDGVSVNEEFIERGDWTGTGAARTVLRRDDVSAAVLESARGGLLRRGLGVESCDVAVVTNVAEDHLGDYGINDVPAMATVKSLVYAVVNESGKSVINADDPELMALAGSHKRPLVLISLDPQNPHVVEHRKKSGEAWVLDSGFLTHCKGTQSQKIIDVSEIPFTFKGSALHNISNAMGAAAAAETMSVPRDFIVAGLRSFGLSIDDNPGRSRLHETQGVRILLDFGHNPHGVDAMLGTARRMIAETPEARLCVSYAQAGDRSDEDIIQLTEIVQPHKPDLQIIRNVVGYERGRAENEVQELIQATLLKLNVPPEQIRLCNDELDAIDRALQWARPGDLIVMLVHLQRDAMTQWLSEYDAKL